LEATPSRAGVSKELFFKEIEPVMGVYNKPFRVRGFVGIDFIGEE